MTSTPADSLLAAFRQLTDPRCRRGIRHPFASLLALTFLGLLCRQPDFAAIARWARHHWDELAGPLGFTRDDAPHQTTLSRAAARYSVAEFRADAAALFAALDDLGLDSTFPAAEAAFFPVCSFLAIEQALDGIAARWGVRVAEATGLLG